MLGLQSEGKASPQWRQTRVTPDQEQIVKEFGICVVEVFNIARGHSRTDSPCVCHVCRAAYDKLSQYLEEHFGDYPAVDYQAGFCNDSADGSESDDLPLRWRRISLATSVRGSYFQQRSYPLERQRGSSPPPRSPRWRSFLSPCDDDTTAASAPCNGGAFFRDTRRSDGRRRTESFARSLCSHCQPADSLRDGQASWQ